MNKETSPLKKEDKAVIVEKQTFQLKEMTKPKVPKNTEQSSKWAMGNLKDWFDNYNEQNPENKCPEEVLLPSCSADILCKWLCVFVTETRSKSGKEYPPKL